MNKNIKIIEKPDLRLLKGFYANGFSAGLKKNNELDLGVVYSEVRADCFGVYTTNKVKGAPILVAKEHLRDNKAQALVVNSKFANTCTGEEGIKNSKKVCKELAAVLGIEERDTLPMSTGVIGQQLPVDKIIKVFQKVKESIKQKNFLNFTKAIMTTDTYPKSKQVSVKCGNNEYGIIAAAKGSGMIHPNMATLLVFIFTDANINKSLLREAFRKSIDTSFNSLSIDGDTSTNDSALIYANGLAKEIVKDGEGATKFIEIEVQNAVTEKDAKKIAETIANSKLVKTAFFGEDANWGRIICALGYSNTKFNLERTTLSIGGLCLFKNGAGVNFSENEAKKILHKEEIKVVLDLGIGHKSTVFWTTDLSIDYIKINASYRS